jgi:hypothetical protein
LPVCITCPLCIPTITKTIIEDTQMEEETVTFVQFDNWIPYAKHIIENHPKDLRFIWAKNSLEAANISLTTNAQETLAETSNNALQGKQIVKPQIDRSILQKVAENLKKKKQLPKSNFVQSKTIEEENPFKDVIERSENKQ